MAYMECLVSVTSVKLQTKAPVSEREQPGHPTALGRIGAAKGGGASGSLRGVFCRVVWL